MNIKNNDLKLLQEIEIELWNKNSDLYIHLYNLNERLLQQKEQNNKKTAESIAKKRKTNKNYARSKKEIATRETAEKRRKEKEVKTL